MATRQTAGKSGKRGTAPAGRKSGTGTTSVAKPARGGAGSGTAKPGGGGLPVRAPGSQRRPRPCRR